MMSLKLIAFASSLIAIVPYALGAIPAGSNTYLPPTNGYHYPKPTKTFSTRPPVPSGRPTGPTIVSPTVVRPKPPQTPPPRPGPGPEDHHHHHDHHEHHEPGMPFDFEYSVNDIETSNDYSHKATSDGDVTRGEYRVQLPDGRTQIVRYTADWKTGFHADVSYEGTAQFPEGPSVFGGQGGSQGYRY